MAEPSNEKAVSQERLLEAGAVDKVTSYFQEIKREWDTASDLDERLILALRLNRKLWLLFLNELVDTTEAELQDAKEKMFKLAKLVDIETLNLMTDPSLDTLERLIQINNSVAAGLRKEPISLPG